MAERVPVSAPPPPPSKRATPRVRLDSLRHMARLAVDLERRRQACAHLREILTPLLTSDEVVVTGEADWLGRLDAVLEQAFARLHALSSDTAPAVAEDSLDEIQKLLEGSDWDLMDRNRSRLERMKAAVEASQQARADRWRQFEQQLAVFDQRITELDQRLEQAREIEAPIWQEEERLRRWRDQYTNARRAFTEQRESDIEGELATLAQALGPTESVPLGGETSTGQNAVGAVAPPRQSEAEKVLNVLGQKMQEEETLQNSRRAELLLLRYPPDARGRHQYEVLLRTPSDRGGQGVNIQDSSTLVEQDRLTFLRLINRIASKDSQVRGLLEEQPPAAPPGPQPPAAPPPALAALRDFDLEPPMVGGRPAPSLAEQVLDLGDEMYRLAIPEAMQTYFRDNRCSITITTNDLELPWELMAYRLKDGKTTFLCLDRAIARMPMGRAFPRNFTRPTITDRKVRFLLIADPTADLPNALREVDTLEKNLRDLWGDRIEITTLKKGDATGEALNRLLRGGTVDVIHYAGHAFFDDKDSDLSGLVLHDRELFLAQKIRRLLEGRPLVFLNACESGLAKNEAPPPDGTKSYLQRPAEGLASAFIYGGAIGCIGSLWPVYDRYAAQFATTFYDLVLQGYRLGEAMRRARRDIWASNPEPVTWAAYVLYGDPTLQLIATRRR
ncbi:MAG: CHAT domain-containing protein [Anaerolineae bacterium]|nr:CHAT domain-containing protein [Anaerolineae bacterium]